jgi:biopolymer transport protein TolQ
MTALLLQAATHGPRNLTDLILVGSVSTRIVLGVMLLISAASWVIIFWKIGQFRKIRSQSRRYLAATARVPRLDEVYKAVLRLPESPYKRVFQHGINFFSELRPGSLREDAPPSAGLSEAQLQALRLVLEKEQDDEIDALSAGLAWLAVIGAVAPLLGLLGTVIGVMDAFFGISATGSGNIGAVAPGIAEALATTAGGLVVAIPAMIAYNLFVGRLNSFSTELEGFASQFIGALAREGRL